MTNFIIIIVFMLLGVVTQRLFSFPQHFPALLNKLAINICIPAVVLLKIPVLQLSFSLIWLIVAAWFSVLVSALLVKQLANKKQWNNGIVGALLMTAVLGNTSYLGFPLVKLFYSNEALSYAIIFDQIGTFLALAIYGTIIISVFENDKPANSLQKEFIAISLRIIKFPPFITLMIALFIPIDPLVTTLEPILALLTQLLVPLTMFIVGLQFKLTIAKDIQKPLFWGLAIKMVFSPLIVLIFVYFLPIPSQIKAISVFESAMPPMVTAGVLAIAANLAPKLCSAMVGYGLVLSAVTIPMFYWLTILAF